MFNLPDGSKFKAKSTKRGYHGFAVAIELQYPFMDCECWTLNSQHTTSEAADKALAKALKTTPHAVSGHVVKAA